MSTLDEKFAQWRAETEKAKPSAALLVNLTTIAAAGGTAPLAKTIAVTSKLKLVLLAVLAVGAGAGVLGYWSAHSTTPPPMSRQVQHFSIDPAARPVEPVYLAPVPPSGTPAVKAVRKTMVMSPPADVVSQPPAPVLPPAPPAERPAVRKRYGHLTLETRPSTEVFLGGKSLGWTPLVHAPLPPGTHMLRLVGEQHDISTTIQVEIRANEETKKALAF